jgi:hypothetical protein
MKILILTLVLTSPLRAQTSAPTPSEEVQAAADQAAKDPAAAGAKLDDLFGRLNSARPLLPQINSKDVELERLKRRLMPRPEDSAPAAPDGSRVSLRIPNASDRGRRETRESVDVAFSRPLPRVELGIGASERNVYWGTEQVENHRNAYLFLRVDLSRNPPASKLLHSPTVVHAESEVGPRNRVRSDEYSLHSLPRP